MMDKDYINAVCAAVDRLNAEQDRQALQCKSSDRNLIYKVHDDARVQTEAPSEAPRPKPDPWAGWNAWLYESVMQMFEREFSPAIGWFASHYVRKRLNEETTKLYGQIADLKVDVAALKSEVKTLRSANNVMPIGKNNAA